MRNPRPTRLARLHRLLRSYGAGQRVTQELFPETSWRESDEAAARIFSAYARLLRLHKLMAVIALAEVILPPRLTSCMRLKRAQLNKLCGSEECLAEELDIASLEREMTSLVREASQLTGAPSASALGK